MAFNLSLITFTPNTTIKSADVNSNFSALNLGNMTDLIVSVGKIGKSVSGDMIDASSSANMFLKATTSINFSIGGTQVGIINSGGIDFTGKAITADQMKLSVSGTNFKFLTGTLSRISIFSGSGSGTYSHSAGATPNFVAPVPNLSSGTASVSVDYSSIGSSTVHISCSSSVAFKALALVS